MDVKLDSLIEKIRKEGIEEAQQASDEMIKEAKQQASSIIDQANKEAKIIVEKGKRDVERFRDNAEADLKQAARNTELLIKEKITALFDNVFKKEVSVTLNSEFLNEIILKIVDSWAKNKKAEILINEKDKQKLEAFLFKSLKKEVKDSITLRVSHDVAKGFRIGLKDDQVYYDFSDEAIAGTLKTLINPRLKEILDK